MDDLWPMFSRYFSADDGLGGVHLVRTLDVDELGDIVASELPDAEAVIGLGVGQAIDMAKFVAWKRRIPLFQVPTAMTVNAPFCHRAGLRTGPVGRLIEPSICAVPNRPMSVVHRTTTTVPAGE